MFVPVLFHNLEGYDSHLLAKSLGLAEGDIKCIPKTEEKYISFSKNVPMEKILVVDKNGNEKEKELCLEMRFMGSLKFTLKSLVSLVKTLDKDQFGTLTNQMLSSVLKETIEGKRHDRVKSLNLLKQKGVFLAST